MTTLNLVLGDFTPALGGWKCEALALPFVDPSRTELLDESGAFIPKGPWTASSEHGGVVQWRGPDARPEGLRAHVCLDDAKVRQATGTSDKWLPWAPALIALFGGLFGAGGTITAWVQSTKADDAASKARSAVAAEESAKRTEAAALKERDGARRDLKIATQKLEAQGITCSGWGTGDVTCEDVSVTFGDKPCVTPGR